MRLISHRGNTSGPNPSRENHPDYLSEATNRGFEVEVDVWNIDKKWYLGHDNPAYEVDESFFSDDMYLHCKNISAVERLSITKLNWFWHESDKVALTSHGVLWCFPGVYLNNGIVVLSGAPTFDLVSRLPPFIGGVCTDYPLLLENIIKEAK